MNPLRKNILIVLWAAFSLAACTNDDLVQPATPQEIEADPGSIVLTLPGTTRALSEAERQQYAASTAAEKAIDCLDVLVFPADGNDQAQCVFHKHFNKTDIRQTTPAEGDEATSYVTMARKAEFDATTQYKVYVLANADEDLNTQLEGFLPAEGGTPKTLGDLKTLVVNTPAVYLTGIERYVETPVDTPEYFLMDATATSTDKGTDSAAPTGVEPLTLNDGNLSEGTQIYATLRRAAAKVTLILNAEEGHVMFPPKRGWLPLVTTAEPEGSLTETADQTAAARFRITPTNIRLDAYAFDPLTGAEADDYLPSQASLGTETKADIFMECVDEEDFADEDKDKHMKQVSTYTYAYPHRWEGSASTYAEGSYLVVRVPIFYNADDGQLEENPSVVAWTPNGEGDSKEWITNAGTRYYAHNYYKIPMGKDSRLDRNTHYVVTGTISAPGSSHPDTPMTLEDIEFKVVNWQPQDVNIGDDAGVHYLYVNKTAYSIRNVAEDRTLTFSSSSPITITVKEAYFTDKEGNNKYYYWDNKKTDTQYHPNYNAKGELLDETITAASAETGALSGDIVLNSPVPDNNLPRTIVLTITNDDHDMVEVTVTQYPLDWIQYTEGVYSYWDDDQWSTYEYKRRGRGAPNGQPYTGASKGSTDGYTWKGAAHGGFSSKFVTPGKQIHEYQYKNSGGWNPTYRLTDAGNLSNLSDYRMYHIQITSTSDEYVLGRPKLDENGHTAAGDDNAQMVSPSFMINSQLGATTGLTISNKDTDLPWAHSYADHYAEVFIDSKGEKCVYRDWRLPTEAEYKIIQKFQGINNNGTDAMFLVMNGSGYWTASGHVENDKFPNGSPYCLRLVRDVYDGESDGDKVEQLFNDRSKWQKNN